MLTLLAFLLLTPLATRCAAHAAVPPTPIMNVIIDTDPAGMIATGLDVDDDLAIIVAMNMHRLGEINVLGLTICSGNTQLQYAMANAIELRRRLGFGKEELPILAGSRWWPPPSVRTPDRPHNHAFEATDASRFLADTVLQHDPQTITILCLGPLTNLAAALQQEPNMASRIKHIVTMAGILKSDSNLDYNFRFDRTAAAFVMKHNIPKTIIPIETCVQAIFGKSSLEYIQHGCAELLDSGVCSLLFRLALQRRIMPTLVNPQYASISPKSDIYDDGFILWDVVALFAMVHPEMFQNWQQYSIEFLPERHPQSSKRLPARLNVSKHNQEYCIWGEEDASSSTNQHYCTITNWANVVAVPRNIENATRLVEVMQDHLMNITLAVSSDETISATSQLAVHHSLGLLPYLLGAAVVILLSAFLVVKILWKAILQRRKS